MNRSHEKNGSLPQNCISPFSGGCEWGKDLLFLEAAGKIWTKAGAVQRKASQLYLSEIVRERTESLFFAMKPGTA
jgi:hypothetical protein